MGRYSTGACTTGEVLRIELSYLLKHGYIKKNCIITGALSWTNGSKILIESSFTKESKYLKLNYTVTRKDTGEVSNQDYKIQLTTIPSNLGRGEVLYFICPFTGRRARILYKCYGSLIWKSRYAYRHRIYYESQQCSKLSFHNTRYWALEKEIERCYKRNIRKVYQGKETRLSKRIKLLERKKEYHDWARWKIFQNPFKKKLKEWDCQVQNT